MVAGGGGSVSAAARSGVPVAARDRRHATVATATDNAVADVAKCFIATTAVRPNVDAGPDRYREVQACDEDADDAVSLPYVTLANRLSQKQWRRGAFERHRAPARCLELNAERLGDRGELLGADRVD